MPHAACFQDWTHVRGSANASVIQGEGEWFDLSNYCSFWPMIDVRGFASAPTLFLEFAPTKDDALFMTITGPGGSTGTLPTSSPSVYPISSVGYQGTPVFGGPPRSGGESLPSRFMRWHVTSTTGAWALTFRIWLNLLPARKSRVSRVRREREAAAHDRRAPWSAGGSRGRDTEFSILQAAPVFREAPSQQPAPSPSQAAAAYEVLARSLPRNHPSLAGVRGALARQKALITSPAPVVASPPTGYSSRVPGGPPPGPPATPQMESIDNIHHFIDEALKAMAFPPVGAAWSVCQLWDGLPYEIGEGGAMGVKVIPRAPMVTTRGGPTFPPWRYDEVATPDERFKPETPIMVFSLSKTVTAIGVMKAVDRLIWSRAFVPLSADTPAYAASAAAILRYPLIGSEIGSLISHSLLGQGGAVNVNAWKAAERITIADLLAHLGGFQTNGIVPGASDWDTQHPPDVLYNQLRADIKAIHRNEIGHHHLYTDDGYYLLKHVIAYLSWYVDGGSHGHGTVADGIPALLALEQKIGDEYRSFMNTHVFANCFSAFGKHYDPPFLKTRGDQSWCMPARPGTFDNRILWKPSFVEGRDPPVWALGGGSDWVFTARSYAWFLTCVRAGMVIPIALWNAMLDPSTLPTPPSSAPFPSKFPWGMNATPSSDPEHGSLVPRGVSTLWWKNGDGNWGPAVSCSRVTDDHEVVNLGQPGCEGKAIGTHSVWLLVGNTVICVVTNSECNPHRTGQTSLGRDYWQSMFFPFGALVAVLNKFNWGPL